MKNIEIYSLKQYEKLNSGTLWSHLMLKFSILPIMICTLNVINFYYFFFHELILNDFKKADSSKKEMEQINGLVNFQNEKNFYIQ